MHRRPSKDAAAPHGKLVTMGVDVGKWLHCEIAQWFPKQLGADLNMLSDSKIIWEGKVSAFEELDKLMRQYQILFCVIDANPERRKAYEFAIRFHGHVKLCFYGKGLSSKNIQISKDDDQHFVSVDRTSWMDASLSRFKTQTIKLPADVSREYREHIKNPIRVYDKDKDGNPIGKYVSTGDDHFAHARTYDEIALPLAAAFSTNKDVASFM